MTNSPTNQVTRQPRNQLTNICYEKACAGTDLRERLETAKAIFGFRVSPGMTPTGRKQDDGAPG